MEMRRSLFIGALIFAASISTLAVFFQYPFSSLRCSLDGIRIDPLYEVKIIGKDERCWSLSSILSAQIWLRENSMKVSSIWVTDEITGEKIEAGDAYYVESEVITTPHTGNKIHVFAQRTEAKLHARQFNGKLVKNPLRTHREKPVKVVTYRPDSPNSTHFISPSPQNSLCLATNAVLIGSLDHNCVGEESRDRLPEGYSIPPDKPPKGFS